MRLRRLVLAGVLGVLLTMAAQMPASANVAWCVYDPPVQVVTPGGHNLVVNNFIYLSPAYKHLASHITADGYALPNGPGGTLITVHIHVPQAVGALHVVASNNRYRVRVEGGGTGGTVVTLNLDVPIA